MPVTCISGILVCDSLHRNPEGIKSGAAYGLFSSKFGFGLQWDTRDFCELIGAIPWTLKGAREGDGYFDKFVTMIGLTAKFDHYDECPRIICPYKTKYQASDTEKMAEQHEKHRGPTEHT